MKSRLLIAIPLLLLLASGMAQAASSVNATLAGYGVPSSIIANLTQSGISYAGHEYTALYDHGTMYFLLNASNGNTFVVGASQIAAVITNVTVTGALSQANTANITSGVQAFMKSAGSSLSTCLQETGLNSGTCTTGNDCQSCQSVPACERLYYQTDGVTGPFVLGIMNFEYNDSQLNSSLASLYASANNLDAANASAQIPSIGSAFANIDTYSHNLDGIDILTVPQNLSSSLSNCGFYGANSGPWYCRTVPYCPFITFNFTLLAKVNNQVNALTSLPFTSAQVLSLAAKVNDTESTYVLPVLSTQKKAQLDAALNASFSGYAGLTTSASELLQHISNASLEASLTIAESAYDNVSSNYLTENFTKAKSYGANVMANLTKVYTPLNDSYASLETTARNNTLLLISAQLSARVPSKTTAALSVRQLQLNSELGGKITDVSTLAAQMQAVHANASSAYSGATSFSLTEAARASDQPFIGLLGYYAGLPYAQNASMAPLYGTVLSLVIGIIIFLVVYLFYSALVKRRRIALTQQVKTNWRNLFAIVWALILLYLVLTYLLLQDASAFSPVSAFQSDVMHAQYIAIVQNGTQSAGGQNCTSELVSTAVSLNKKPILALISGSVCTIGNTTHTADYCYNYFAYGGVPAVVLTNSTNSSIDTYSLYGSQLRVFGDSADLNSCYASFLLR